MVTLLHSYINNMTIGHQIIVKELLRKVIGYGTIILGISLLSVILYFIVKYPPMIPPPIDGVYPPVYSPYPGTNLEYPGRELEYRLYLEEKLLEYRRSA